MPCGTLGAFFAHIGLTLRTERLMVFTVQSAPAKKLMGTEKLAIAGPAVKSWFQWYILIGEYGSASIPSCSKRAILRFGSEWKIDKVLGSRTQSQNIVNHHPRSPFSVRQLVRNWKALKEAEIKYNQRMQQKVNFIKLGGRPACYYGRDIAVFSQPVPRNIGSLCYLHRKTWEYCLAFQRSSRIISSVHTFLPAVLPLTRGEWPPTIPSPPGCPRWRVGEPGFDPWRPWETERKVPVWQSPYPRFARVTKGGSILHHWATHMDLSQVVKTWNLRLPGGEY